MQTVRTEVIKVTPQLAKDWLGVNTRNRTLRTNDIIKYAGDMAAGRWSFTAEPIKFSETNVLLDGQHRLLAVIDSGVTIEMLVVWGLRDESQHSMDSGIKRTAADALSLADIPNASLCAAGARLAIMWETGLLFRDTNLSRTISTSQIEAWLGEHPEFAASVSRISTIKTRVDCSPTAMIVAHWRFAELDPYRCEEFFLGLADLENLPSGSPILALHKRLLDIRRGRQVVTRRDYLAMLITAWNRWGVGKSMTKIQRPVGARWTAKNFPEPR